MKIKLTSEQQAIVNHSHGPALVFAVAGSGKTTAMVHRIERLVREKIFPPEKILATSFNKSTVNDLKKQLKHQSNCSLVNLKTLHSIGNEIILLANKLKTPRYSENGGQDTPDGLQYIILNEAKKIARAQNTDWKKELDTLSSDDFLCWIGAKKGNLEYCDLATANLPRSALRIAKQAKAPNGMTWYLDLYCLYEYCRNKINAITYDDMLMTGWEFLHRYPSLLQEMRGKYRCIMVDEFQDVNLAQSEILDLLSCGRDGIREYMAIGDDDQTIYEWRGASPQFILNFEKRYSAKKYIMSDNFRCKATQVFLANSIIKHNTKRENKHLTLTQGFSGGTMLISCNSQYEMASRMVDDIRLHLRNGKKLNQIVVLIRTYDQTPYLEQALVKNKIPYKIEGSSPFYKRAEISTILSYLSIGDIENRRCSGSISEAEEVELCKRLIRIWNIPKRYLRIDMCTTILNRAKQNGWTIGTVLKEMSSYEQGLNENQRDNLNKLGELLLWLSHENTFAQSAPTIISELIKRIEYKEYLSKVSAIPESGQAQIANIESLRQYSIGKGNIREFLQHIRELASACGDTPDSIVNPCVLSIRTIYRAKGLEWPIVLVPHCNESYLPHPNGNIEEERRLMYVAVTRSKEYLYLYEISNINPSLFLVESEADKILSKVDKLIPIFNSKPEVWNADQLVTLINSTYDFNLYRYFTIWAPHLQHRYFNFDYIYRMANRLVRIGRFLINRKPSKVLSITTGHIEPWEEISPFNGSEPEIKEFDGLDQLIAQISKTHSKRQSVSTKLKRMNNFEHGSRVRHPVFGEGTIVNKTFDSGTGTIEIKFDNGTKRKLLLDYACNNGMIQI